MTALRVSFLICSFALIALALVHLRTEQIRCASRSLRLEADWIELRRESWKLQSEIARLRAPGSIHDRTMWFQTDLVAPTTPTGFRRGERLVDGR